MRRTIKKPSLLAHPQKSPLGRALGPERRLTFFSETKNSPMPKVKQGMPMLGVHINPSDKWAVETDVFRMRVRERYGSEPTYNCTRPERRRPGGWTAMWQTSSPWKDLSAEEVCKLVSELEQCARWILFLNLLREHANELRRRSRERRRTQARDELKRWIGTEFIDYFSIYQDDPPTRYTGGPDGGMERVPFWKWAATQLDAKESERLAEKKREIRRRHDLPPHVQLV